MSSDTPRGHQETGQSGDETEPDAEQPAEVEGADDAERKGRTDKVVFGISAVLALAFVVWGVVGTDSLATTSSTVLDWIKHNAGWAFVLVASGFVIFVIWIAASRYGRIPLGNEGEKPEFRTSSWIAMMFSTGMGIGLMFFGVSEPLTFFTEPPPQTVDPETVEAMHTALATTLFHWTLHPWAMYAVVGMAIAYGAFRLGRKQLISAAFAPLFGEARSNGAVGKAIDVLAIFATMFGTAASLGLGALQIGRGLEDLGWMGQVGSTFLVIIIAVLTAAFVASAVSGVAKGIQWLANINMVLAVVLAVFVFVIGPTVLVLNLLPTMIGDYFNDLAGMVARTEASGGDPMAEWLSTYTVFYWAWWVSWTPFVGMFIARISRGRTIRQFVAGVLLAPSLVSLVWFAIFGGTAIDIQGNGVDLAANATEEGQMFAMLRELPLADITSTLVMVLVAIFFVAGADAGSVVMGTLSQRGSIHPTRPVVIFWGVLTGGVAAVMMLVGGDDAEVGLNGLRDLTIVAAAPFMLVMVLLCISFVKDLHRDPLIRRAVKGNEVIEEAVEYGQRRFGGNFQLTVRGMVDAGARMRGGNGKRSGVRPPAPTPGPPPAGHAEPAGDGATDDGRPGTG